VRGDEEEKEGTVVVFFLAELAVEEERSGEGDKE